MKAQAEDDGRTFIEVAAAKAVAYFDSIAAEAKIPGILNPATIPE